VKLRELQTIELRFTGHAFGRKMKKSAQPG